MRQFLKEEYPINLILAIQYRNSERVSVPSHITDDILRGIEYAISTLKEREQRFIEMRYQKLMTSAEIANAFGVGLSYIYQFDRMVQKHLSAPDRLFPIMHGMNAYIREKEAVECERTKSKRS